MRTNENPPSSRGRTRSSACSSSQPSERSGGHARAMSSATSAESVVESNSVSSAVMPGSIPSEPASSAVLVRLPL